MTDKLAETSRQSRVEQRLNFGLTLTELERLLAQPEYKAYKRLDYSTVPPELMDGVHKMDSVVTFGSDAITLFDDLGAKLNRVPSQKEYVDAGLPIYEAYWKDNQHTNLKINGYPFTRGVKLGVIDRMARAYTSRIVEIHLELMLNELGYTVRTHPLIDSIMGVDLIVEDDLKRYYIHVTTSKYGLIGAEKSVMKKQKRRKIVLEQGVVQYGRDFRGDIILCYESMVPLNDGSTKWINGNPVFNKDFIEEYMLCKKIGNKGELLTSEVSKIQGFKEWAGTNLKVNIAI